MFGSNLDVTVGAFSKWFKYLHPLSAAHGTLRVERMAKDSPGCGDIAHDNRNRDGKGGDHNGSRAIQAAPPQIAGKRRAEEKGRHAGKVKGAGCGD